VKDEKKFLKNDSPMVRRVRGKESKSPGGRWPKKLRIAIPRKGRIRIVLVVVIALAAIKLGCNKGRHKPAALLQLTPALQTPAVLSSQPDEKPRQEPVGAVKQPNFLERFGISPKKYKVHEFSHDDLVVLLRKHPPSFKSDADTVLEGDKRSIIHYSINFQVQEYGEKLLKRYHPKYGAIIAMEPATGRVLAAVSYMREGETPIGDRLYCRSLFPAASTFKTVTAAGAIEKGNVGPADNYPLAGRRYTLYKFQLAPNLQSGQEVSLEDAYSLSINPIFGRIGIYVLGIAGLKEYMGKFGFNSPVPFDLDNENPVANLDIPDSLMRIAETSSGFNRTTKISPLFGALIASSVCEKGKMPTPYCVDSVTVMDTSVIYRAVKRPWHSPMKEATASQLKYLMTHVVEYGTARRAFRDARHSRCFDDVDYGGKTGSIDEEQLGKIDWFIGFACHVSDPRQRITVGIVTVHDQFWTVHSAYIGEELFRTYLHGFQGDRKSKQKSSE
jgi:cell division protein FtsI/penicillin-binding protein 2